MPRDYRLYLDDIQEAVEKIQRYTAQIADLETFVANEVTVEAVLYNFFVIGEAVKHIPDDMRDKLPEIDRRKIAGLRDIIAHAYFSLKLSVIWDIVQHKLSDLGISVKTLLQEDE